MNYKQVLRIDVLMTALQIIFSIIYIASWWTLFIVRIPRLIIGVLTMIVSTRITEIDRRISYLKFEWIFRLVTLVLYILLSLGFSSYLPLKFCHLFDGLLGSTRTNDDEIQTLSLIHI